MLIPYPSAFDPEVHGEGSIECRFYLGVPIAHCLLASAYFYRLADWIFPGMTARMWRRDSDHDGCYVGIVEPFFDVVAKDCTTSIWLFRTVL